MYKDTDRRGSLVSKSDGGEVRGRDVWRGVAELGRVELGCAAVWDWAEASWAGREKRNGLNQRDFPQKI